MRVLYIIFILLMVPVQLVAQEKEQNQNSGFFSFNKGQEDLPTYIKSDSLALKSEERTFVYTGNVEVKQGDLTITSDFLDGKYDQNNKIQELVARQNVVIIKGDNIRAHGQRATYDAATETVVLTENPELQQNGSVLSADLIRIFLKEDRSTAEGQVRVKLVNDKEEKKDRSKESLDVKSLITNR